MSVENFVKFHEDYLPKDASAAKKLDGLTNETTFAKTAVQLGKEHGFEFSENDVAAAMAVAEKNVAVEVQGLQLGPRTVKIRSLASIENIKKRDMVKSSTVMCCW